jgi:hypothetical protein
VIVVDYSCGLDDGEVDGLRVIAPDAEKQRFGDPPSRTAYLEAFLEAIPAAPAPVVCLVGPYGYSPAFTAASGARNDLGRHQVNPDAVRVVNPGRALLGLGALAAAAAALPPHTATSWLDEAAIATSTWIIVETARLESLGPEYHIEAPDGLPLQPFSLLRVRLAARVVAGFDDAGDAVLAAAGRAAPAAGGTLLVAPGLGFPVSAVCERLQRSSVIETAVPAFPGAAFGDCFAFAIAPSPARSA